ncbi:hypothetical protein H0H92_001823 [Tricholoma furcatifolium]|nr:hypothetical protein H0H92_001823 [Tricholoma furcatifolium]
MPPADIKPTAKHLAVPDGQKPSLRKRLLNQVKPSASNPAAIPSTENLTAPDGKTSAFKRLSEAFKSTNLKGGHFASAPTLRSVGDLPGSTAAPTGPEAAASTQPGTAMDPVPPVVNVDQAVSTTPATVVHTLTINVDQGSFTTSAAAGPTSAIDANQASSTPAAADPTSAIGANPPAINPVSSTNINQPAQPGPNVTQAPSRFKERLSVAIDGLSTALRVAKEAADWNPFLKAALGGVVAVVDLAETVRSNSQDMEDTVGHIQGLLPILETSAQRLEGRKDGFGKQHNLMTFADTMQTELKKIQTMQSHGLFQRVLQGTKDADALLSVYSNISEALEQFKSDNEPVYWLTGPAEALEKDSRLANGGLEFQLEQMLIQPWEASTSERVGLSPVIVIVDALDENQSGSIFLHHLLCAVGATRLRGLKVFVTSREDEQIARLCNTLPQGTVLHLQNIQKQTVQNDIQLYLKESLPDIHDHAIYQELFKKLIELSDGLFIYAATVVKMVTANDTTLVEQVEILQDIVDLSDSLELGDLYFEIVKNAVNHNKYSVQASRLQVL